MIGIITKNANLTEEEKNTLIKVLYDCYFNTDQDGSEYGEEFYYIVGEIYNGYVPIKLDYLCDFKEIICDAIPRLTSVYERKIDVEKLIDEVKHKQDQTDTDIKFLEYHNLLTQIVKFLNDENTSYCAADKILKMVENFKNGDMYE